MHMNTELFRFDAQLRQIDGTMNTIENQREALESASANTAVLSAMALTTNAVTSLLSLASPHGPCNASAPNGALRLLVWLDHPASS